jgi:TRAP-type C4-dicarboxylate transport system permease small subunit
MNTETVPLQDYSMLQRGLLRLHAVLSFTAQVTAYLSAVGLVLMIGHILLEIALRNFFGTSTYVLDEFVGYATAAITFNTLGYAFERGVLIRVNFILNAFAHDVRVSTLLETAATFLTLMVVGLAGYHVFGSVMRSYQRGALSETVAEVPMWIPETLMLVGLLVFWVLLLMRFLASLFGVSMQDIQRNVAPDLISFTADGAKG